MDDSPCKLVALSSKRPRRCGVFAIYRAPARGAPVQASARWHIVRFRVRDVWGFAGLSCQTLLHGGPHPELGAEFINAILDLETQAMLAKKLSNGPVVQEVPLPPETLARMPYGEGKETLLFASDWDFINTIRPEWTERWNKVFS